MESRPATTRRLAQSRTATTSPTPCGIGMSVLAAAQTWFGRVLSAWRRREGDTVWAGCRWLVRGGRYTAARPLRLIRAPANGEARCRASIRRISTRSAADTGVGR